MGNEIEGFERATRRARRVKFGLLGALLAAPLVYVGYLNCSTRARIDERREARRKSEALSERDIAALRELIPSTRAAIEKAKQDFAERVTPEAMAAVATSTRPCPHRIVPPTEAAATSYIRHNSIDANYFGNTTYTTVQRDQPIPPTARLESSLETLRWAAEKLAENKATRTQLATVREIARDPGIELWLVVEQAEQARADELTFTPGRITGTAYVYSYRSKRIECVGSVTAKSSETVEFTYRVTGDKKLAAEAMLQRDLEMRTRMAIPSSLRATSP